MREDFVQSIPTADIRKAVADFAAPCLSELLQSHGDDLYGFAINTVSDAVSVYWTAGTRSHLSQQVSKRLAALEGHPDAPTADQLRDSFEFEPADWPITDELGKSPVSVNCNAINGAVGEFWTQFESGPVTDDNFIELAQIGTKIVFNALGDGLSDGFQYVDWSAAGGRDKVTMLVWVNDPDEGDLQVVREIAARLNPEKLYANFARTYYPSQ